jgi:hypothetical protein
MAQLVGPTKTPHQFGFRLRDKIVPLLAKGTVFVSVSQEG